MWLSVDQLGSGYGTPVALSSRSEPSPKPDLSERSTGREWSPSWLPSLPECCRVDQCGSVSTGQDFQFLFNCLVLPYIAVARSFLPRYLRNNDSFKDFFIPGALPVAKPATQAQRPKAEKSTSNTVSSSSVLGRLKTLAKCWRFSANV